MGKTLMGQNARQTGAAQTMDPSQLKFLQQLLPALTGQAQGAYSDLLQPYSEEMFQQSVVDPAMKTYEQQMLPQLQQQFVDANANSSSALNQALAQSAGDMSNLLAGQRLNLQQNVAGRQQGALQGMSGLLGAKSFDPIVQGPQAGLLKDIMQMLGSVGGGMMMSSAAVKENIRDYTKGLEAVRTFKVKQYDYKQHVEVEKHTDRVGLIAEDIPDELTGMVGDTKAVDLYGLVSVLVNAVKQLDVMISNMEKR